MPLKGGLMDCYRLFRKEVTHSCPIEADLSPLMSIMEFQYRAPATRNLLTRNQFPCRACSKLAHAGKMDEAMEI